MKLTKSDSTAVTHGTYSDESEFDSDMEPEQLVSKYVSIKSKIYNLDPGFSQRNSKKDRKSSSNRITSPAVAKLVAQLAKIERDVLFDSDTADRLWSEHRLLLIKDKVSRKRLGLDMDETRSSSSSPVPDAILDVAHSTSKDTATSDIADESYPADDDMLGGMFLDDLTDQTAMLSTGGSGDAVTIRDFGEPKGVQPRRILEELIRTRSAANFLMEQTASLLTP
jgi:ATP-dependent RNA helicase DHX29